MAQYINKDALVAEIERLRDGAITRQKNLESIGQETVLNDMLANELNRILSFINTLEVKEVDLEKELVAYHNENLVQCNDGTLLSEETGEELTWYDYESIAKHFFELGLKQSSSDEYKLGESEIYLNDDGGEPPYDGKQWLDLSCTEYEIPSDKFKDGDNVEIIIRKAQKGE